MNELTIKIADILTAAIFKLQDSSKRYEVIKELFPKIDSGTPFADDVEKENMRLLGESKKTKMACGMKNLWRNPKVTISKKALLKYEIEVVE